MRPVGQLWTVVPRKSVDHLGGKIAGTHKDGIEPSVYMFPIVQFLVDVLLDANTRSSDGFLPVDLTHVSEGFATPSRLLTVSLIIVPTSRSKFGSSTPIN